ncbi:hypothetical protein ACFO0N_11190 [Halobium salinum]|uniref:Uncharacterized protein n=1 Tax=Halobium salinum TaxID=1364940 RepID=A0ABD5PDF6_9EURY|nr:hypothetical protein [Halobium salinum]
MKRRQVLAALGTSTLTSAAGCATLEAELGLRTDSLEAVTLANSVADTFGVSLEVARNGSIIHQSTHHLEPGTEEERPQVTVTEWRDNPKAQRWTVRAKVPNSDWRAATIDASRGSEDECYSVAVVTGDWPESPLFVLLQGCDSINR